MFNSVLTVCIGNICRSPMAEAVLRHQAQLMGNDLHVESAGLGALSGHPADPVAIQLMERRGIDIRDHRARQLTFDVLREFDLILVMEQGQQQQIERLTPLSKGRVFTLGRWGKFEIPDPYRRPTEAFERALQLIDKGVADWLDYLKSS